MAFKGRNYGVGCPGGVEVVAHSLRDTLKTHKSSKLGLLKIDFRNAFNEIKRDHFVKAVYEIFPAMSNWTQWCYGEATMLFYDHQHIIESCAGVQQGDPLGPLYFCCGINALVNEIASLNPIYNKWYMDDGGIVGDVELLKKVWEILKSKGPALGMHLNPSKCEWSWLDPDCVLPCPIKLEGVSDENQVKLVPHSEIQMLGVPLGDVSFVSEFVEKKLLGRLQETVAKLVEFEDTQAASYLLRVSYSIVRAVHFMRTTPLYQWHEQGEKFDDMVRTAVERILGFPMDERTFAQAALTPKLGGLGLRKSIEHAGFAYSASFHESMKQAKETWTLPPHVEEKHVPQSKASYQFDEEMFKYLVDSALDERGKQRLLRVAQPHAGGFVTAVPSEEDGKDTILRPRVFRTAIKYRLGVPVLSNEILCPLCTQTITVYGDHATCCAKSGDLITRHNTLRNWVNGIARDGLLNPVLEKKGILGPTSGRRPGDVTIPNWEHGNALAIDVAITSPFIESNLRKKAPAEDYGIDKKHKKYDRSFKDSNHSLCAMVFETLGAVNEEGEVVLKQLFSFAAKELGREFTSFCSRAWARLSCSLQRAVAQAILNRIDGNSRAPALQCPPVGEPSIGGPVGGEPPVVRPIRVAPSELGRGPLGGEPPVSSSRGVPPEIPMYYGSFTHRALSLASKKSFQVGFQNSQVSPKSLVFAGEREGRGQEVDLGSEGEREGEGQEAKGFDVSSVVSVVRSSGSSRKIGRATTINMKNNNSKDKKDREVGRGGRKTSPDNTYIKHPLINSCTSPVVCTLEYSQCSPLHSTAVIPHITSHTSAGEPCGMSDDPNEAAYGLHKCRSAGAIVERKNRAL